MAWAFWIWLLLILVLLSLLVLIVLLLMWARRRRETPTQVFQPAETPAEPTTAWNITQEAGAPAADTTVETAAETEEATAEVEDVAEAVAKVRQDVEQAEKETAEPVVNRMQETVAGELPPADDLKIVEGIGPKISSVFQAAGITTLAQLAATDVDALRQILTEANIRLGDPSTWPEQAGLAAEGKWEELAALQDSLKGGRRA